MNDNQSRLLGTVMRPLMIEANVSANGRWGCLGMAAIALYLDEPLIAFWFVLALFLAYIVEQLPRALMVPLSLLVVFGVAGATVSLAARLLA